MWSPTHEAALAKLESIDLDAVLDDPQALAVCMIDRQHALDALKGFSLSAVEESERGALRARIEAVLARDAEVMQFLDEARDGVKEQLAQLVTGRALARSYGGMRETVAGSVKRMG